MNELSTTLPYQKHPSDCSTLELAAFHALAVASGEVSAVGLEGKISAAHRLAFAPSPTAFLGIAAIKNPLNSYRVKISCKAGIEVTKADWPFELGWVFVVPTARNSGLSKRLVASALDRLGAPVFATARTDNVGMLRVLQRFDFAAWGADYESEETPGARIQIYKRKFQDPDTTAPAPS